MCFFVEHINALVNQCIPVYNFVSSLHIKWCHVYKIVNAIVAATSPREKYRREVLGKLKMPDIADARTGLATLVYCCRFFFRTHLGFSD